LQAKKFPGEDFFRGGNPGADGSRHDFSSELRAGVWNAAATTGFFRQRVFQRRRR